MKNLTFFLILFFHSISWSQDVDLLILLSNQNDGRPIIHEEVWLIHDSDTLVKKTNLDGAAFFSTQDTIKPLKVNTSYKLYIPKDRIGKKDWLTEDDYINTTCTTNTRIIRDYKLLTGCNRGQRIDKITFEKSSEVVPTNEIITFFNFLKDHENLTIELRGEIDQYTNLELAKRRSEIVRDSLILMGINSDRLFNGNPAELDETDSSASGVCFIVLSADYYPCTGLNVVNFNKKTNTILETRCDSLVFFYEQIMHSQDNFAIIGIYHDQENSKQKEQAQKRAELIQSKLIEMGVPKNKLEVYTQYYPANNTGFRDWPFYPLNFTYEIGVVLNVVP